MHASEKASGGLQASNSTKTTDQSQSVNDVVDAYMEATRRTKEAVARARDALANEMEARDNLREMFEKLSFETRDSTTLGRKKKLCGDNGGKRKKDGMPCQQHAQSKYSGRCRFHKIDTF